MQTMKRMCLLLLLVAPVAVVSLTLSAEKKLPAKESMHEEWEQWNAKMDRLEQEWASWKDEKKAAYAKLDEKKQKLVDRKRALMEEKRELRERAPEKAEDKRSEYKESGKKTTHYHHEHLTGRPHHEHHVDHRHYHHDRDDDRLPEEDEYYEHGRVGSAVEQAAEGAKDIVTAPLELIR